MAVTRTALKRETHPKREGVTLATFVWQGTDKRGVKMKGEQQSRNANFLRAELRRQGITPTVVKVQPNPLFSDHGKPLKPPDIASFRRMRATMTTSGVTVLQALERTINGPHKKH